MADGYIVIPDLVAVTPYNSATRGFDRRAWVVTHIPTGLGMGMGYGSVERAAAAGRVMAEALPWLADIEDADDMTPEQYDSASALKMRLLEAEDRLVQSRRKASRAKGRAA